MDVLDRLKTFYDGYLGEKKILTKTYGGRDVYALCVNKSPSPKIICQYAIHGREYITTNLAMKELVHFSTYGKRGTVWFIPMLNPDGVYLSLYHNPKNKANLRMVDLNVNFDADWGRGEKNVRFPAPENYIGTKPFSERETRGLRDFTLFIKPDLTLSYHTKGEEIYFEYGQDNERLVRDGSIAKIISKRTGYKIKSTPNSVGGYKDWCIKTGKIPSFTIEVGSDNLSHPITEENFGEIYSKNIGVIKMLTEIKWLKNLWAKQ